MKHKVDYIIVGSGLAGISLAMAFLKRSKKILLFNDPEYHSSTKVAAGLYNPVTGRKMVKTWRADQLFPALHDYYLGLETLTDQKFLHQTRIYRPFLSLEEQNEWMGKSSTPEFSDYVHKVHLSSCNPGGNDPLGGVELSQSGYLDTDLFFTAMRHFFESKEVLVQEKFDFDQLAFNNKGINYRDLSAAKVIFCDGTYLSENPFFSWLPFKPVKGEILSVKAELATDKIINRGVFCVPLGGGMFRVGSNYDNNDLSWKPTDHGRLQIETKLRSLLKVPFNTIHQTAGIRPATKDRKPYLGLHPRHETIGLFNGLGTKGVSLSPYFGSHFAAFLEGEIELDNEVNISRYFSLS